MWCGGVVYLCGDLALRGRDVSIRIGGDGASGTRLKLVVTAMVLLAMLACGEAAQAPDPTTAPPPGMFSKLPTNESPILGDQPPTIELNTPEPTLTPQPTPTPNPTYTPVPTPTPLPTPTPNPTGTPMPTATPNPTATPEPTSTPEPTATSTPNPTATPMPTQAPMPVSTTEPTAEPTVDSTREPTAGTGFDCTNKSGARPLHQSVKDGSIEFATTLAGLCPEHVNVKYEYDFRLDETPLSLAVKARNPEMVKMLLEVGADPNQGTQNGFRHDETPLTLAVKAQDIGIVRILVVAGADPNKRMQFGFQLYLSPLEIAIDEGYTEIFNILTGTSN